MKKADEYLRFVQKKQQTKSKAGLPLIIPRMVVVTLAIASWILSYSYERVRV